MTLSITDYRKVKEWAWAECVRQDADTPEALRRMIEAWNLACLAEKMSLALILGLGSIIEPEKNDGFRKRNIAVGHGTFDVPPDWRDIPRLLMQLVEADISPAEWYQEFQRIHPFLDGNGRVGALIYNKLSGTLDPEALTAAPEYRP